jgi:hypothetical protein
MELTQSHYFNQETFKEDFFLLGHNNVQCDESQPTFRRSTSSSSLVSKRMETEKAACSRCSYNHQCQNLKLKTHRVHIWTDLYFGLCTSSSLPLRLFFSLLSFARRSALQISRNLFCAHCASPKSSFIGHSHSTDSRKLKLFQLLHNTSFFIPYSAQACAAWHSLATLVHEPFSITGPFTYSENSSRLRKMKVYHFFTTSNNCYLSSDK